MSRLKTYYQDTIIPKLKEQFGYTNIHQVPKVVKVTINRGLGEASQNAKALESSLSELAVITGQKPVVTRSKKAIAGFKIRQLLFCTNSKLLFCTNSKLLLCNSSKLLFCTNSKLLF